MSEFREFWIDKQYFVHGKNGTANDQGFNCLIVINPEDKSGDYLFKVIEKRAFDELLEIAEELNEYVFCAAHEGAVCTLKKPCITCQVLDKFTAFKERLGE